MSNKEDSKNLTEADKIWKEIKDVSIDMFSLPNQKVNQYFVPKPIEVDRLYLLTSAYSALPALEVALGNKFNVELSGKYIVVSRVK